MTDLFASLPTEYDLEKVSNYVLPGQNPVLKQLSPFRNMPLPEPGFWLVRQHRHGAWCPAAIMRLRTRREPGNDDNVMDRSPFLAAYISGEVVGLEDVWMTRGRKLSERDYWRAVDEIERARARDEYDPRANPRKPIKSTAIVIPFRRPK